MKVWVYNRDADLGYETGYANKLPANWWIDYSDNMMFFMVEWEGDE